MSVHPNFVGSRVWDTYFNMVYRLSFTAQNKEMKHSVCPPMYVAVDSESSLVVVIKNVFHHFETMLDIMVKYPSSEDIFQTGLHFKDSRGNVALQQKAL